MNTLEKAKETSKLAASRLKHLQEIFDKCESTSKLATNLISGLSEVHKSSQIQQFLDQVEQLPIFLAQESELKEAIKITSWIEQAPDKIAVIVASEEVNMCRLNLSPELQMTFDDKRDKVVTTFKDEIEPHLSLLNEDIDVDLTVELANFALEQISSLRYLIEEKLYKQ